MTREETKKALVVLLTDSLRYDGETDEDGREKLTSTVPGPILNFMLNELFDESDMDEESFTRLLNESLDEAGDKLLTEYKAEHPSEIQQ